MIERLLALPVVSPITPSLSQRQIGELTVIVIDHPKVRAAVSFQGAHVLAWQPAEAEHPGLWLSENSAFTPGVPVRGGIPICWPWFGPVQAPAHGFARTMQWDFTAHNENEDGVFLTFTLRDSAETRKIWPHEFTLIARIRLGDTCEVELEAYGQYQATAALRNMPGSSGAIRPDRHLLWQICRRKRQNQNPDTTESKNLFPSSEKPL